RLRLPTYPFERQLYCVEPRRQAFEDMQRRAALAKRPDVGDWFYVPSWRQSSPPRLPEAPPAASWLLLLDQDGIGDMGERLAERLREMGQQVTAVAVARERSDYDALLRGEVPDCIVHLEPGFHSLLALAGALADRGVPKPMRIEVVTTGVQSVTGGERIEPEKALVLGPVRVIPQEMENVSCRAIDIEDSTRVDALAADLVSALADPPPASDFAVAWRGARRWVQGFEAVKLPAAGSLVRPGGVYLITGGLGGVGLALAEHLARAANVRLVLIGRSPVRENRLARLLAIEELGSEVLAASADVRDPEALRAVIAEARQRFGVPLSGVIHAAGVASGGMIQLKTPAAAEEVLSPKVAGTRALAAVLADEPPLDFFVLCSAINSVLGGFGRVDFCAASAFLDAFALERTATVAIDWDTWSETGQAAESELPPDLEEVRRESLKHGMTTAEALEVFDRVLASGLPRVVVSTRDLAPLLERRRSAASAETADTPSLAASHGRPALSTAFVAPESETELTVAGIWEEFLGIQGIGAHDNFFELGGHSLMATQIASRLRATFQAEFTIARFFEDPTVAGLAASLSPPAGGGGESEQLSRLLEEVEGLSEEELDALLAAEEEEAG
ncbi:MAG TPA: SDR family NAD(P)-dependent oxidoreductase, partial [Thermoanaerobaculia bacterium]|nr:SDR family NAD(P)-dependent oxidoreductase [Thermoanaerobaculia bacterium]